MRMEQSQPVARKGRLLARGTRGLGLCLRLPFLARVLVDPITTPFESIAPFPPSLYLAWRQVRSGVSMSRALQGPDRP